MPHTLPRLFAFRRPTRTIPRANRRRHARGTVVAGLFAVVLCNAALGLAAELYPRIRDPYYGDKLAKLQAKLKTSNTGPAVVMLGSSRVGFAFHGARIEDRSRAAGLPVVAFNFGIPAAGPITQLLYSRRLFRDGVKPDLLLLEILPNMFRAGGDRPLEAPFLQGDRLSSRELLTVTDFGFPDRPLWEQWHDSRVTPWYGLRFQLLGRVVQSWIPWQMRYDWSRNADAWGWGTPPFATLTPEQRTTAQAGARAEYAEILHDWRPGGPAVDAMRQLLRDCAANGVAVKLVLMPESAEFRGLYPPPVRERLSAFSHGLAAEFACELVDAREWLADDLFTDGHHQLRSGAEAFSDRLTQDVILPWRKP